MFVCCRRAAGQRDAYIHIWGCRGSQWDGCSSEVHIPEFFFHQPQCHHHLLELQTPETRARRVSKCTKQGHTSNLPHCVREHPPPHSTERGVRESSGSLQSIQDSVCLYVCAYLEWSEKEVAGLGLCLICLFENKIASFPRRTVWYDFLSFTV